MKRVYTSANLAEVDLIKSILGGEGIDVHIRNEFGAHTVGGGFGAMAFAWPELWVADEDFDAAQEIIADL